MGALLDPGSFAELDAASRTGEAGGAVVGVGTVDGRDVAVAEVDLPSLDETGAAKVAKVQELALRSRIPIVVVHDALATGEPADLATLAGWAGVLRRQARSSGIIPQIAVRRGTAGPLSLQAIALADLALPVDEAGAGWNEVRRVLSFLPAHCGDAAPVEPAADPAAESGDELQNLVLGDPAPPLDLGWVARRLLDAGDLVEVGLCEASPSVVLGFGRLAGRAVGVMAAGAGGGATGARFVRLCDAFGLPILSLVDAPGEPGAAPADLARLTYAYAEASAPMLTLVAGRVSGAAYLALAPRALGADLVVAWPTAVVATGDAYAAAERGAIDGVVEPRETRAALIRGLELCLGKTVERPRRRHGNIPL
jgi:propionyl-CoA carboxylase beta chain